MILAQFTCGWTGRFGWGGRIGRAVKIASWMIVCGVVLLIGCRSIATPDTSVPPVDEAVLQPASEPAESSAASPHPLTSPVVARSAWDKPGMELLVVGRSVGRGQSDFDFEVIEAQLLLTAAQSSRLLARVPLGKLTRRVSGADQTQPADVLDLSIQPLGQMERLDDAVAFERAALPDGSTLLLVYLMLDVNWGLTERYAVLVTIRGDMLVAGDRVRVGRDAMEPPTFFGTFRLSGTDRDDQPELILKREGMGRLSKHSVFKLDAAGAFRAAD